MNTQILHKALQVVKPATGRFHNHVVCEQNGCLRLTTTDQTIWLSTWIENQAPEYLAGVDLDRLLKLTKAASGEIEIEQDTDGPLSIISGTGTAKVFTFPVEECVPTIPAGKQNRQTICVNAKDFTTAIEPLLAVASGDASRFNLNSILFDGPAKVLVATDGHRLLKVDAPWLPKKLKALVPADALDTALRSLGKQFKKRDNPELTLTFGVKHLLIEAEPWTATIALTPGEYPDYAKLVTKATENRSEPILYDKTEFIHALRLMKIMTSDRNRGINITHELGCTEFQACHPDLGTARHRIFTEDWESAPTFLTINCDYAMEAAKKAPDPLPFYWQAGEGDPVFIGDELIMPMRR